MAVAHPQTPFSFLLTQGLNLSALQTAGLFEFIDASACCAVGSSASSQMDSKVPVISVDQPAVVPVRSDAPTVIQCDTPWTELLSRVQKACSATAETFVAIDNLSDIASAFGSDRALDSLLFARTVYRLCCHHAKVPVVPQTAHLALLCFP